MRRVKQENRERESCWKSGGGRTRLYTWPRVEVADEARSDAIPDAAGGEGGHGAAKPEGVIHRYIFNKSTLTGRNLTEFPMDIPPVSQPLPNTENLTVWRHC
jgi:hypothetical protein